MVSNLDFIIANITININLIIIFVKFIISFIIISNIKQVISSTN